MKVGNILQWVIIAGLAFSIVIIQMRNEHERQQLTAEMNSVTAKMETLQGSVDIRWQRENSFNELTKSCLVKHEEHFEKILPAMHQLGILSDMTRLRD